MDTGCDVYHDKITQYSRFKVTARDMIPSYHTYIYIFLNRNDFVYIYIYLGMYMKYVGVYGWHPWLHMS